MGSGRPPWAAGEYGYFRHILDIYVYMHSDPATNQLQTAVIRALFQTAANHARNSYI